MSADQIVAGRYRLAERLGGGGMGVVWQAHDERLRRTVAVKQVILPPSLDDARLEEIRKRTMREGRIAAKLHHPQLITVYDVIEDDGRPYLVMEYLPSTSLSKKLAEDGTLPPEEVARIGAQAAAALASAHAAGVVHRDVKPGNILVGDNGTVKITDFGVSRVVEDVTGTATGTFVGTPAYLAPEVAQGKDVTFASDVYSLGATLYTAVEGASPAGASDNPMLLLHRIASGAVTPPKKAGPLNDLLLRMLSTDPQQRPTMDEARAELEDIAGGRSTAAAVPAAPAAAPPAEPAAVPKPAGERPHRRRAVALLAAVCVLVAIVTTLVVLNANDNSPTGGTATPPASSKASGTPAASSENPAPAEPEETGTTSAPATTSPAPPANTPPKTAQPPGSPVAAVTGYYALMPGDPDAGWQRLTPKFQQSPAGGPDGYRRYWSSISSVRASGASGAGSTVTVTVNYVFKSGRKVREQHRYNLVNQDGRWLIDTVTVLSSTDLR
ncbi:MAG TPA: protein kinase [Actinophytocola sp.]|jgi:serine/threonine protein kinase|uniref:serine/threonine protein kinase n=1 Tax=Actinophytocola sp. TaxID=1872138 RepID=UPI002F926E7E